MNDAPSVVSPPQPPPLPPPKYKVGDHVKLVIGWSGTIEVAAIYRAWSCDSWRYFVRSDDGRWTVTEDEVYMRLELESEEKIE